MELKLEKKDKFLCMCGAHCFNLWQPFDSLLYVRTYLC